MKVALITPWANAWVPLYRAAFKASGHDFAVFTKQAPSDSDIVLHGWATGTPSVTGAVNIVFLRRYELFANGLSGVDWSRTDALICVNSWLKSFAEQILAENKVTVPVHLIYNAVNGEKWKFTERAPGKKVGMACFIHSKKNLPLALQILAALPDDYELHIAGAVQDVSVAEYLNYSATQLGRVLQVYDQVPSGAMDKWWDGMDYCLSTSITEGNPNNVIEAMAKGIKPVVHNWPGAMDQFDGFVFNSVSEAVDMIRSPVYESVRYREIALTRFGSANIERVVDLAILLSDEKRRRAA